MIAVLPRLWKTKGFGGFAVLDFAHQRAAQIFAFLFGDLREAGLRLAVRIQRQRDVAQRIDVLEARNGEIGIHVHPPGAVQFDAEQFAQRRARTPAAQIARPTPISSPAAMTECSVMRSTAQDVRTVTPSDVSFRNA